MASTMLFTGLCAFCRYYKIINNFLQRCCLRILAILVVFDTFFASKEYKTVFKFICGDSMWLHIYQSESIYLDFDTFSQSCGTYYAQI